MWLLGAPAGVLKGAGHIFGANGARAFDEHHIARPNEAQGKLGAFLGVFHEIGVLAGGFCKVRDNAGLARDGDYTGGGALDGRVSYFFVTFLARTFSP